MLLPPADQQGGVRADALDGLRRVGHQEQGHALIEHASHPRDASLLKSGVADGEDLVDDEDVRAHADRHAERQPSVHPAGVHLHRLIQELADVGERGDLVEPCVHLASRDPQNRAREVHVLTPRELRVETAAEFEQRRNPAADVNLALGRRERAGDHLHERALARAVAANDAHRAAPRHVERRPAQGPERPSIAPAPERGQVPELVDVPLVDVVPLADVPHADRDAILAAPWRGPAADIDPGFSGHRPCSCASR